MRVTVLQTAVIENRSANVDNAMAQIRSVAAADLIVLPEMFVCPYVVERFPDYAEEEPPSHGLQPLACLAREKQVTIVAGTVPERVGLDIFNTCFVFDPAGRTVARYRKTHLFDVDIAGGPSVRESDVLTPGGSLTLFTVGAWSVGLAICYDLRFPELFRALVMAGADVIIVPAAFSAPTGAAHWADLLKVRAVDNQVYVVGAAPARDDAAPFTAYGHSMVVDPWGVVLAETGSGPAAVAAELQRDRLDDVRRQLPLLSQLRPELYGKDLRDR